MILPQNVNIYFDVPVIKTGGVEIFALNTGISLHNKGVKVYLIESVKGSNFDQKYLTEIKSKVNVINLETFLKLSKDNHLKHIIVTSWNTKLFSYFEEIVSAHKYKSHVQIIGYLHNDAAYYYDTIKLYEPIIRKFICVSEKIQQKLKLLLPDRTEDILFKYCPTSISNENKLFNLDESKKLNLLFVGRIQDSHKGVFKLPLIYQELINLNIKFNLVIVGIGEDLQTLKMYFNEIDGAKNVQFIEDAVTPEKVKPYYKKADIFILTSNFEGGPIVIYEAMACKVVPISFNVGNVSNIIINEHNGFMVENFSFKEIIQRILELNSNRNNLSIIGNNAYQSVEEKGYLQKSYDDFFIQIVKDVTQTERYKNFNNVNKNIDYKLHNLSKWVKSFIPSELDHQYQISNYINLSKELTVKSVNINNPTTSEKFIPKKTVITVIIPVYNVEKYIIECVDSVINQSYGIENIEVLVIDDLGNDNSISIIKNKYFPKYKDQIKIITHTINKGLGGARNTGVENSSSDYIYFLDSDDALYPNAIEKLYNSIVLNKTDISIGGIDNFDENLKYRDKYISFSDNVINDYDTKFKNSKIKTINITVWNKLYKKELLIKKFIPKTLFEDEIFTFELCSRLKSVSFIAEPVYKYRRREGSITTVDFNSHHLNSLNTVYRGVFEVMLKNNLLDTLKSWLNEKIDVVLRKFTLTDYQKIQYFDLINRNLDIFSYESLVNHGIFEFLITKINTPKLIPLNGYINKYIVCYKIKNENLELFNSFEKELSLSIIVPVFNSEEFLPKLIDSIVYQYKNGIELILVNDNSTDNSAKIIEEYQSKYQFIKLYNFNENKGAGAARNFGLKQAKNKYILFHDSDDNLDCNALNMINYYLNKFKYPELIIFSFTKYNSDKSYSWGCNEIEKLYEKISTGKEAFQYIIDKTRINPAPWNKVFLKSTWIKNNLYFPEDIHHQDLSVIPFACYLSKSTFIAPSRIYNYIDNKHGVSFGATDLHVISPFNAISYLYDFFKKYNSKEFNNLLPQLNILALNTFTYNFNFRKNKFTLEQRKQYKNFFESFSSKYFINPKKYNLTEYEKLKETLNDSIIDNPSNPLVSVIITTYRRPENLQSAINSVISQTYQNIELIVVDDNDNDSEFRVATAEIIDKYSKNAIKYIKHEKNSNGACARNSGIKNSKGSFICFLDDDDVYLPTRIERSIQSILKYDESYGAVYCGFLGWNSSENDLSRYKEGNLSLELLTLDYEKHYLHTNTATYRKEALEKINGFDESFNRHQDLELNLRFFKHSKVGIVPEALVKLRPEKPKNENWLKVEQFYHLKLKFLTKFKNLIQEFPFEDQIKIYYSNWNDIERRFPSQKSFVAFGAEIDQRNDFYYILGLEANLQEKINLISNENIIIKNELGSLSKKFETEINSYQNDIRILNNEISNYRKTIENISYQLNNKNEIIKDLEEQKAWYESTYEVLPIFWKKGGALIRKIKKLK
ncbi:MAG: hypothetical protein A2046_03725 [Bacteroidetes bacterium GWA2_30_7]|nr:MAG: hypothetical protein A2046_03725 [Bacteroidetes bacterium GWA2_30_7]